MTRENNDGFASLALACNRGNLPITEALIRYGAQVYLADVEGYTPPLLASYSNRKLIAKNLIQADARLDQVNNDGYTAMEFAKQEKNNDIEGLHTSAMNTGIPMLTGGTSCSSSSSSSSSPSSFFLLRRIIIITAV